MRIKVFTLRYPKLRSAS